MYTNNLQKTRKRRKKTRVTIIVGIISKTSIVLGCDSQTTAGTAKRTDTAKISALDLSGHKVLVAEAGDCTLSSRTVEALAVLLRTATLDDYRKPADLAQEAVASTKKDLRRLNNWENDPGATEDYLDQNPFSLMLAYYYDEKPWLFTLDCVPGFATKQNSYACLGCGGTVGEFILGRMNPTNMTDEQAIITAFYTVEEVKKVDCYCGGPCKIGILTSDGESNVLANNPRDIALTRFASETIAQHDEQLKSQWRLEMDKIAEESHAKFERWKADHPGE